MEYMQVLLVLWIYIPQNIILCVSQDDFGHNLFSYNVSTDVFLRSFAGKPSTTVRPLVSCDNQNSHAMNDPEEISTHTSMATKYHPSTQAHFQSPALRGHYFMQWAEPNMCLELFQV
jgi:hypothetical protein